MPTQAIATIEMIQNLKDGTIPVQKANQDSNGNTITLYYAHGLNFTVDPQTFILTATLTNALGGAIATQQVDLPLESVVVSGSYDDTTQEVVLTLQNGSTVRFSVADLVDGLASQSALDNVVNNTTKIAETNFGGFSAGENSSATTGGGAVGSDASTLSGGAVGSGANSTTGGAIGFGAYTTTGFAGGYMAKASANGAVQLGEGTNTNANTLQFRGYQVVDANGNIPSDRLANAALKKTWDNLATYTYSGSGSLPNNILYPTMAFGDCEYREIIGADFNDIINNGHYVIRTNSTNVAAHAPINGSTSTATNGLWHLIVLRYTETFIRQIAIDARNGTNAIQVRNYFNSSWGEWQSLLYTNNSVTRLMTYTTSSLSGNRTLSGAYYNYAFIIVRYYPSGADYWVEDIIPVDYLAEYPGTSSARRVLTTQTTNGWCNYWFSSGTTFNWNAGDMYRVEVYAY